MSSTSQRAFEDLTAAEAQLARQTADISFRSVRNALGWFFERRETLTSPNGMHPRGEVAPDGSIVVVSVDGGRGGDMADVHATMLTIHNALAKLQLADGQQHQIVVMRRMSGLSQAEIAKRTGLSQQVISALEGKAESFLLGALWDAGVVR